LTLYTSDAVSGFTVNAATVFVGEKPQRLTALAIDHAVGDVRCQHLSLPWAGDSALHRRLAGGGVFTTKADGPTHRRDAKDTPLPA
jgi:hypothetical protein